METTMGTQRVFNLTLLSEKKILWLKDMMERPSDFKDPEDTKMRRAFINSLKEVV